MWMWELAYGHATPMKTRAIVSALRERYQGSGVPKRLATDDGAGRAPLCSGPFPTLRMAESTAPMVRSSVPAADRLIGVKLPVLEHGYVVLVDYMGSDAAIVQAARVSYGAGTKTVRDDRGLIRYLMRHHHTTPFEMVEVKFLLRLPIYVARQVIRHRTANVNEYSARYSVVPDEFDVPAPGSVRLQSTRNRQGRGDPAPPEVDERFRTDLE